jgi:hypothetical protein
MIMMKILSALKCLTINSILVAVILLFFVICGGCTGKSPSSGTSESLYTFENEDFSIQYGTEWLISGKTDNSIVLTHRERPGNILLSLQWFEDQITDATTLIQLYKNQLNLFAADVQKLEDFNIGTIRAERYASLVSRSGEESVVTLHVLFNSQDIFYQVTFSATQDDFSVYTSSANQVIDTIRIK